MSSKKLGKRGVTDYFDSHSYYRFHHEARPDETLYITDSDGNVDMGQFNTSSSENWQLYYQQGRWFIRPYATSVDLSWTEYQLGLAKDDKGNVGALPKLAKRSGELGQQWTFAQVDDGNGGFGFKISNALLGNTSFLALTGDGGQPGMQSSSEGTVWDMQINRQAGNPGVDNSYEDVANFEVCFA
ncbi:uncharacterized protein N0V89_002964 [Didymosphaeria variabile]|uniref:Uncharacterized protein n=1 Tax=Didymosphaeria variabile TaxID=1932322 RepID=A0A9W8XVS9_9PLEO|nr:uncharacterized protein N0V89_002964 [Didymosphaeria variabile]KAJ4358382.1 hypothetical protein N0V89_002964 [Didymosphaeria variabile]